MELTFWNEYMTCERRATRLATFPDLIVTIDADTALPLTTAELAAGEAHRRGINMAIETAFNVPWAFVEKVLPHVDVVLHDHKLTDSDRHRKWTGVPNKRILENLRKAYETFPDKTFIARTPLIPGVNDDEEHIRAVLAFIQPYKNVIDYELLPYMRFGESKSGFLGRVYEMLRTLPANSKWAGHLPVSLPSCAFRPFARSCRT